MGELSKIETLLPQTVSLPSTPSVVVSCQRCQDSGVVEHRNRVLGSYVTQGETDEDGEFNADYPAEPEEFVLKGACSCEAGKPIASINQATMERFRLFAKLHRAAMARELFALPLRYVSYSLRKSPVKDYAEKLRTASDLDASWYLWGSYGVGKTGLAVGYAWRWVNEVGPHHPPLFTTVPDMLSELRTTFNNKSELSETDVIAKYGAAGLLVMDDLGAEQVSGSGWVEDRLYQIIGRRHGNKLPTVFTSNLSLKDVAARIGERVTWRIAEMCGRDNVIHVEGKNQRALP